MNNDLEKNDNFYKSLNKNTANIPECLFEKFGVLGATIFEKIRTTSQNDCGHSHVSHKNLGKLLGVSPKTINTHIKQLIKEGLLIDDNPGSIGKINNYKINIKNFKKFDNPRFEKHMDFYVYEGLSEKCIIKMCDFYLYGNN